MNDNESKFYRHLLSCIAAVLISIAVSMAWNAIDSHRTEEAAFKAGLHQGTTNGSDSIVWVNN